MSSERVSALWRNFLSTCDFHGTRFIVSDDVSTFRKVLWFLVVILAAIGFITASLLRFRYYIEFPYSVRVELNEEAIPVPGIAICSGLNTRPTYKYYNKSGLSTPHFVYLYHLMNMYGLNLLSDEWNTTSHGLDEVKMDFIASVPNMSKEDIGMLFQNESLLPPDMEDALAAEFIYPHLDLYRINLLIADRYKMWDCRREYRSFMSKIGVKRELVISCKFFLTGLDDEYYDCRQDMVEVMTDFGMCLMLNTSGRSNTYTFFTTAKRKQKGLEINLHPDIHNLKFARILYFSSDVTKPIAMYGDYVNILDDDIYIGTSITGWIKNIHLSVVQAYSVHRLGYRDRECIDDSKQVNLCIHECFVNSQYNCSYFYMLESEVDKPYCNLKEQENVFVGTVYPREVISEVMKCRDSCGVACSDTRYYVDYTSSQEDSDIMQGLLINLNPSNALRYEIYTELPLYTWGSLLAELGGMLGLFVGASVITLYHILEYITLSISHVIDTNMKRGW